MYVIQPFFSILYYIIVFLLEVSGTSEMMSRYVVIIIVHHATTGAQFLKYISMNFAYLLLISSAKSLRTGEFFEVLVSRTKTISKRLRFPGP